MAMLRQQKVKYFQKLTGLGYQSAASLYAVLMKINPILLGAAMTGDKNSIHKAITKYNYFDKRNPVKAEPEMYGPILIDEESLQKSTIQEEPIIEKPKPSNDEVGDIAHDIKLILWAFQKINSKVRIRAALSQALNIIGNN